MHFLPKLLSSAPFNWTHYIRCTFIRRWRRVDTRDVLISLPLLRRSRPRLRLTNKWKQIFDIEYYTHIGIFRGQLYFVNIIIYLFKNFEWAVTPRG